MKQVVRIIGGQFRGKQLRFPENTSIRPTPARVRETVFNWLMHITRGACCLDAFAGSGALGFEAFSRGAQSVTLLELCKKSCLVLKQQARAFRTGTIEVIQTPAEKYLGSSPIPFDIIFLDPPFNQPELITNCIQLIEKHHLLQPNGFLYTESSAPVILNEAYWQTYREKKAGQVIYALHQQIESQHTHDSI